MVRRTMHLYGWLLVVVLLISSLGLTAAQDEDRNVWYEEDFEDGFDTEWSLGTG